jgi:4-hydroxy-3-polyprenylbenzoate decarboxylase
MLTCSKQGLPKIAMVFDEDVDIWDDNRIAQAMAFRYMPDPTPSSSPSATR